MTPSPHQDPTLTRLLTEAEIDAERLVALLRMLVALSLGAFLFLAITPDTPEDSQSLLARQWIFAVVTVASYFLLGLVTWGAVRRGRFRRWMIWPTATADVLFMVISLWLSMRNTGMMGDATFAFPSVWLVPMVLAFAVLRVSPAVMAYVVALLVAGIGVLISLDAGQLRAVTQSDAPVWLFLSPPPNLMRLGMVLMAGVVLVVAARRARRLLLRSITEARRSANLTRYLPAELAPRLAEGGLDALRQGTRTDMGVLFIDMRGFTAWAQGRPAQEVTALMTAYRARIAAAARQSGGIIDKFMGDAAMILFAPGDDPARAARGCIACAEALSQTMAEWSRDRLAGGADPVRVGIGAHWGAVFAGVVGEDDRLEYSVFGDTVNVAARLESLTRDKDMEIVLSRDLLEQAGAAEPPAPGWQPLGAVAVRGRQGTVDLWGRPPPASDAG